MEKKEVINRLEHILNDKLPDKFDDVNQSLLRIKVHLKRLILNISESPETTNPQLFIDLTASFMKCETNLAQAIIKLHEIHEEIKNLYEKRP